MKKRIILLSDGTGNSAARVWRTNVWRVFEALDLRGSEQVAFYDDGVGTSSFKPLAILGGAFGWGLKRNVIDLYKFLCRNYNFKSNDDDIFAFGFSRGAFTIRILVGLVSSQGLVKSISEEDLDSQARAAYRAYRKEKFHSILRLEAPLRIFRDWLLKLAGNSHDRSKNHHVKKIRFLGLWDTVAAYGLPVDEMTRGISQWIWPLELPDRSLDKRVERACHALAIDEERTTFQPVLWNEKGLSQTLRARHHTAEETVSQVWFAGVHSNVGGGYPDDSLAYIPLYWIMQEAEDCGLKFKISPSADPDSLVHSKSLQDKDGRLYDSRSGLAGYYRYGPRKIADLCRMRLSQRPGDEVQIAIPKIHESALRRAAVGAHAYAPIGIPDQYEVVTEDRRILSPSSNKYETPKSAAARAKDQEDVWNVVWRRRAVYFLTVFASLYLVIYPLAHTIDKSLEYSTRLLLVSDAIEAINWFLPKGASTWVNAYARDPAKFLIAAAFVVFLIWLGSRLGSEIIDRMQAIWKQNRKFHPTSGIAWKIAKFLAFVASIYVLAVRLSIWIPFREALVPTDVKTWVDMYATIPVCVILFGLLTVFSLRANWIFRLRTSRIYKFLLRQLKLNVAPFLFAVLFAYIALASISHLAFDLEDANKLICVESFKVPATGHGLGKYQNTTFAQCKKEAGNAFAPKCGNGHPPKCSDGVAQCAGTDDEKMVAMCKNVPAVCEPHLEEKSRPFKLNEICTATGIYVEAGGKYLLKVVMDKDGGAWKKELPWSTIKLWGKEIEMPWKGDIKTNLRGFYLTDIPNLTQRIFLTAALPLKRSLFRPWFRVIVRVGSEGIDEHFLDPDPDPNELTLEEPFTPKRGGELFIYVNDGVFTLPAWRNLFYQGNKGSGTLTVRRLN
jgi:uncharacterized protein (DUF2235 family)